MKIWSISFKSVGVIAFILISTGCLDIAKEVEDELPKIPEAIYEPLKLNKEIAEKLSVLPLECIQQEYPNKLGQVLNDSSELGEPHELHPAFYGCFDWHSSVHGHWSLVKLLKEIPDLSNGAEIKRMLLENISEKNILKEVAYFEKHKSYERTYGWGWLLKLGEELHTWDDPMATELSQNLKPLADLIENQFIEFLPKLLYPIRVGTHTNTGFGIAYAWDYANTCGRDSLKNVIERRAREYFYKDYNCPITWEPSGYDFLSPCFEEIDIMRRILTEKEFKVWLEKFMPELKSPGFSLRVAEVSDREDGHLVHLDGLNFSRAWVLYGLAKQYPDYNHLVKIANDHVNYSLPNLVGDSYEGGHWLGSFAIQALDN